MVYNVRCMVRKQIYLTKELAQDVYFLSLKEKKSQAEVVRSALTEGVERHFRRIRKKSGSLLDLAKLGFRGPGDLSVNHDEYLYGEKSEYAQKLRWKKS